MAKRKNMMDMTPVCERCGKVAPVDNKISTPNWTVYRAKEPCVIRRTTMPDEYIRRAEALEITTRTCGDYAAAFAEIRKLPAADVAPVVHGQWVDNGIPDSILNGCSVCGFTCGSSSFFYCPKCGAWMDGAAE